MLATIAYRMLSKAVIRGAVCMSCVAATDGFPIIDLRGQLPTSGEYPVRDVHKVDTIVIHHSATQGQGFRSIAEYHIAVRGWAGIAYHYGVGYDGKVYQMNSVDRKTNQTQYHNTHTIGIVLVGNYDTHVPSPEMIAATEHLVAFIRDQYPWITRLDFHRSFKATECPGRFAVQALDSLRTQL